MANEKTKVVSFRVDPETAERIDTQVRRLHQGSRQQLLVDLFLPAFRRFEKRNNGHVNCPPDCNEKVAMA